MLWFERWFNSPYYHLLYGDRDELEAAQFIDQLLKTLNLQGGSRILDIGCGKGRHARQISSKGYEVYGIDLSEQSIQEAKKHQTHNLEFFVHDMRQLFWHEHFKLVVNLFTSFGYFHNRADDKRVIDGVFDALMPGGRLVIDFMNTQKVVENLISHEEKTINDIEFIINRKVEKGMIEKTIHVIDGSEEQTFVEEVDELYLSDFEALLSSSGFDLQDVYGDYQLSSFDSQHSDRLIIVASKPSND